MKAVSAGAHARHASLPLHGDLYWNIENNLVRDVMARTVYSVTEETPFKEIVDILARHRISAVPVIDADHRVVGIVSESDLLAKVVAGGDPRPHIKGGHATKVRDEAQVACRDGGRVDERAGRDNLARGVDRARRAHRGARARTAASGRRRARTCCSES